MKFQKGDLVTFNRSHEAAVFIVRSVDGFRMRVVDAKYQGNAEQEVDTSMAQYATAIQLAHHNK